MMINKTKKIFLNVKEKGKNRFLRAIKCAITSHTLARICPILLFFNTDNSAMLQHHYAVHDNPVIAC